ncbi:nucleoside-diphosphate sugar epimerase [Candidatus Azambacteria bacterium RIFOXYD1_FULL_42_11]|uniref:UDP-glucuronate decarboxylase n=1 Tax=Candidatus Azambacteria bacterium RIFOXYD1_FULL_42_11 TaxID=1797310 RepID=A0A1F5CG71_9BACT|nr:MAG: nucleoside-diphosphate sugar epimerase [Candidatus Azambacteria bacterium RIFOXYD1_FULL_42_11]
MNKILITGGAGFIGSHLAEKLLQKGEEVFVIDDLSTGSSENIKHLENNPKFHFIKGSVLDKKLMSETIIKVDEIYHLAAAVGVKTVIEKPLSSLLNNLLGAEIVFEVAAQQRTPVLLASTSEVYGKNENIPFQEDSDRIYGSAYHTRWGYGMSKGVDEFLALAYFREKRLPVIIARLFNVIGPRQSGAYGMVVPRFIHQALKGESITIYGDGAQTRCFGYVDDVVDALIRLMASKEKASGQIFNVGSDEEISIKDLAQKIIELTASASKINFISYAEVYGSNFEDMFHRQPDLTKIKETINYQPKFTLEESLKKIIDQVRHNG